MFSGKFGNKDAQQYFIDKASRKILMCFAYYLALKPYSDDNPTDHSPMGVKLMFVLECLNEEFKGDLISESFFHLQKYVPNHCPEHYAPK